jgi:hypothetical protein
LVRLIAFALIFEAMFAGLYVANLIPQIGIYHAIAIALIVARGLLGAVQFVGGWLIATHRPQGATLAQWGLAGGAIVTILGVGFDLAPSSIYPLAAMAGDGGVLRVRDRGHCDSATYVAGGLQPAGVGYRPQSFTSC